MSAILLQALAWAGRGLVGLVKPLASLTFRQWLTIALVASAVGLTLALPIYHRREKARERRNGFAAGVAHADSLARGVITGYVRQVAPLLATRDIAIARTDTALTRLAETEARYRKARAAIATGAPVTPDVRAVLDAADALAAASKPVLAVVLSERAAAKAIVVFDSTAIRALGVRVGLLETANARLTRENRSLRARVKQAAGAGVVLGVAGFLIGRR